MDFLKQNGGQTKVKVGPQQRALQNTFNQMHIKSIFICQFGIPSTTNI